MSDDAARPGNSDDFMVEINKVDWAEKGFLEPGETHKAFFDFIVSNEYLAFVPMCLFKTQRMRKPGGMTWKSSIT